MRLSLAVCAGIMAVGAGRAGAEVRHLGPADGLRTQVWRVGSGQRTKRVVFCHPWGGAPHGELLDTVMHALDRTPGARRTRYEVYAPWLRPMGRDAEGRIVATGEESLGAQLERVRPLLSRLGGPLAVLGHSLGGRAILSLLREGQAEISCAAVFSPAIKMAYRYWKARTGERSLPRDRQRVERVLVERMDALQRVLREGGAIDSDDPAEELVYVRMVHSLVAAGDEVGLERLLPRPDESVRGASGIHTPTLLVHGTAERNISIHYARRLADQRVNPGVRLLELEGLDHGFWSGEQQGIPSWAATRMGEALDRLFEEHLPAVAR